MAWCQREYYSTEDTEAEKAKASLRGAEASTATGMAFGLLDSANGRSAHGLSREGEQGGRAEFHSERHELQFLRAENYALTQLLHNDRERSHRRIGELESFMKELRGARELDRRSAWILEMVCSHAPLPQVLTAIAELARSCAHATSVALWTAGGEGESDSALSLRASSHWPGGWDAAATSIALDAAGEISEISCARLEDRIRREAALRGVEARFIVLRDSHGKTGGLLVALGPEDHTWGSSSGGLLQLAHLAALAVESGNLHQRLAFHAQHDVLTGLPNRLLFEDRAEQAIAPLESARLGIRSGCARSPEEKLAVLWIDLDRFKQINDTFGHKAGDELLLEIARRLRRSIHSTDTVARFGGDEFTILISPVAGEEAVESIAARILKAICFPVNLNGHEVRVSASIGMSLYPDHGQEAAMLMRNADLAMYHAKRSGRNQCRMFLPDFGNSLERHLVVEEQLSSALERNEFHLEYQPLTDLQGEIAGMEALLRWVNPKLGNVAPAEFIPQAEEMGLIIAIGEWVARAACRDGADWIQSGFDVAHLAINVSALQLVDKGFADMIGEAIQDSGFPAHKLELEVTETVLIRDLDRVLEQISQLRARGVRFSIDDFGRGYSSLNQLRTLPIDVLKIDHSFIRDIEQLASNSLVRGIIVLAHSLQLKVVAEGVETEAQLAALRSMGCDRNQGFHLYRPMDADALRSLLSRQPCLT